MGRHEDGSTFMDLTPWHPGKEHVENRKPLPQPWTGTTYFDILRTKPPAGYEWVGGRPTRIPIRAGKIH